uniref:Uncharacterized protein n=1 Tax=Anguilla anguilla TaxID=7936 RepID=A0A0E9X178_ANGAN
MHHLHPSFAFQCNILLILNSCTVQVLPYISPSVCLPKLLPYYIPHRYIINLSVFHK